MPLAWTRKHKVAPADFSWASNLTFYDSTNKVVTTANFQSPPTLALYDENGIEIKSTDAEYPEQCLSHTFIDVDACVLELGARYGSVSCVINKKLQTKSKQVSVEPDSTIWNALERNIKLNDCNVNLHKGFVSRKPLELLNYGYASVSRAVIESSKESLSVEQLESKYNILFDTLVADCEGFLESFFDENPHLYSQLHTVIFEADYPNRCNYDKIRSNLKQNGFKELVHGFQNVYKKHSLSINNELLFNTWS
jgi:FkbM family methyltransferase